MAAKKSITAKMLRHVGAVFFCTTALVAGALVLTTPEARAIDLTVRGGDGLDGDPFIPPVHGLPDVRVIGTETYDTLIVQGGDGGDGVDTNTGIPEGDGGNGGDAALTADQITTNNNLVVASGSRGRDGLNTSLPFDPNVNPGTGGAGGSARLDATSLLMNGQGKTATITKNDGDVLVRIGTLGIAGNTTFTLNNTAANEVLINGLAFHNGSNLTMAGNGLFSFHGGIGVTGKGASYSGPSLNASGQRLHFLLPADIANNEIMLSSSTPVNITGATVALDVADVLTQLKSGQAVILINNTTGAAASTEAEASTGAITYNFAIDSANSNLRAILGGGPAAVENRSKAYSQSRVSGLLTLAEGAALIDDMFRLKARKQLGFVSFTGARYLHQDVGGDDHIRGDSISLIGGMGWRWDTGAGRLTAAAFLEGGWGDNARYADFHTGRVKGDEDVSYFGGGLMAVHEFNCGLYFEGSVRTGRVYNDYSTHDLADNPSYNGSSWYWGAHGGIGWLWPIGPNGQLDTYARLMWTHINGSDESLTDFEDVDFDAVDSLRSRLGARYTHNLMGEELKGFVGAAWEYEFDGEQSGGLTSLGNRHDLDEFDLKGHTAVGEIGIEYQATEELSLELAGQGLLGQRDGGGASFLLKWKF